MSHGDSTKTTRVSTGCSSLACLHFFFRCLEKKFLIICVVVHFFIRLALATQHIMRILNGLTCKQPRPKIIPVQTAGDSAGKTYSPHCTILHRCGDDTGCCGDSRRTCSPKHQMNVDLYFFVSIL